MILVVELLQIDILLNVVVVVLEIVFLFDMIVAGCRSASDCCQNVVFGVVRVEQACSIDDHERLFAPVGAGR